MFISSDLISLFTFRIKGLTTRVSMYACVSIFIFIFATDAIGQDEVESRVFIVAIDSDYAPYEFIDARGAVSGYTPELLEKIGQSANIIFKFVAMNWPDAMEALQSGQVDLLNMIYTPERAEEYIFSMPHSVIEQAIFRNILHDDKLTDLASLSGHRVGLQMHDISDEMLAARTDIDRHLVQSKLEGLMILNLGEIDAFLCSQHAGIRLINEYELHNVVLAQRGLFKRDFCFAATKRNQELINILNEHLSRLQISGEIDRLTDVWFAGNTNKYNWIIRNQNLLITAGLLIIFIILLIIFWNITLQKEVRRQTQSLSDSEKRYRAIFEQTAIAVALIDGETGTIQEFNDKTYENLGYTREEFAKMNLSDIDVNESPGEIMEHTKKILKTGEDIFKTRHRTKQGEIRDIQIFARLTSLSGQRLISALWHDITDLKRAEDLLRKSEALLIKSQEIAHLGSWEFDSATKEMSWSDEVYRILGFEPQEFNASYAAYMDAILPEDREYVAKSYEESVKGKTPIDIVHRIQHNDGDIRYVQEKYEYIYDNNNGNLIKTIGTILDVTESKLAEERMQLLMGELDHRVKNSIARILSLAEQTALSSDSIEQFSESFNGRLRAMSIAHDMLSHTHWSGAELSGMVERIFKPYQDESVQRLIWRGEKIVLSTTVAPTLCMVLNELLTNAAKYGSLSVPLGSVKVDWTIIKKADNIYLNMVWRELGGPEVFIPSKTGLGTRLIDKLVSYQLHGKSKLNYARDGVICDIIFPLKEVYSGKYGNAVITRNTRKLEEVK